MKLASIFYIFSPYVDGTEQAVGSFFKNLSEHHNQRRTRAKLGRLLQRNIAVINLWTEYRYKGYTYLGKSERRKLYANLQLIADDFAAFYAANRRPAAVVMAQISKAAPHTTADPERAVLLRALMDYFSPARGVYEYRESSSFGRLLRDPSHEKLIGDCNQVVTLYMYLYSRYYDAGDLQIRILPEHVALHYAGIDIETTSGTFADYSRTKGGRLLPAEEIVSANLLDTSDAYLSTHTVAPEDFLQAARLAFILSHDREVAGHNLHAAYTNAVNAIMQKHDYKRALAYALASRDRELIGIAGNNGAVHEMERHHYAAARRFAQHAPDAGALITTIWEAEGAYHYQAGRYHDALKAFTQADNKASVRYCYEGLFFAEQAKLGTNLTNETIKQYAAVIKRMRSYAKKSGNSKLMKHADGLYKYL